jgi:hypothetical protein
MRCSVDTILIWEICKFYQPKTVLEIGFYEGQTLGLIAESLNFDAQFVSVDTTFHRRQLFDTLFPEMQARTQFLENDSASVRYQDQFDFAVIDGDHTLSSVTADVKQVMPNMSPQGIIYMDDINTNDVIECITNLAVPNQWIPFCLGDQGVFLHQINHSAVDFLTSLASSSFANFLEFRNTDFYGSQVMTVSSPAIFEQSKDILLHSLKFYNL